MSAGEAREVRQRLAAGPARGLGCAPVIALEAAESEAVLREVVWALEDERVVVVPRAANALKKVQAAEPRALDRFAAELVSVASRCKVLEARWNLWLVTGRLRLTGRQRAFVVASLLEAMASRSALERVHAIQALVDVSSVDLALRRRVRDLVQSSLEDRSAAVRARARLLRPSVLKQM